MRRILDVLAALDQAEVDTVVVGGVAVVLRGHARMTVDLDLALDLAADNVMAVLAVLANAGLVPRLPVPAEQFADADVRRSWVEERNLVAFSLHDVDDPLREVDLLATQPVPYSELREDSDLMDVDGVRVRVASIEHLIRMKRTTGRPQDLADADALSRLSGTPIVDQHERD